MTNSEREEMALKLATLHNDLLQLQQKATDDKRANTYLAHALVDAEMIGGRFVAVGRASVTGSGAIPHSNLPAPSWAGQDNAVEPPYGVPIDAHLPVGEIGEIEQAARILREREVAAAAASSAADVDRVSQAPREPSPSQVETATRSTPSQSPGVILGASATGGSVAHQADPPTSSRPAPSGVSVPAVRSAREASDATVSLASRTFQRRL